MRRALVAALIAVGVVLAPVAGASAVSATGVPAARGSVPPIVGSFVAHQLIDRLDDAPMKVTGGVPVDVSGATPGPIVPVFFLNEDARAGRDIRDPLVPRSEWVVPVMVGEQPVGAAVVAGDLDVPEVHLDSYRPDTTLATGAAQVGPTAALVHDPQTSAWFTLDQRTVWPIIPGTSGIDAVRPLDRLDLDRTLPRVDPINPGTIGALIAFAALVLIGLAALAVPRMVSRRLDPAERERSERERAMRDRRLPDRRVAE